jgi:hypothetical protein
MELLQDAWTLDQEKQLSVGNQLKEPELEKLTDDVQYTVLVKMKSLMSDIAIGDVTSIGKLKGNVLGLGARYLAEKKRREARGVSTTNLKKKDVRGTLFGFLKNAMSPNSKAKDP